MERKKGIVCLWILYDEIFLFLFFSSQWLSTNLLRGTKDNNYVFIFFPKNDLFARNHLSFFSYTYSQRFFFLRVSSVGSFFYVVKYKCCFYIQHHDYGLRVLWNPIWFLCFKKKCFLCDFFSRFLFECYFGFCSS